MANNLALPNDWVVESTPQNDFEKNNASGLPDGFEVERISGENSKAPSLIENVINTLKWVNNTRKSAYQEGKDMVRTADLETKDATVGLNYVEQAELDKLTVSGKTYEDYGVRAKENYKNKKWTLKGLAERAPHFAKTSYIETLKTLPIIVETTKSAVSTGAIGAGGGAVAGLVGGPFSELTVPAGAGMGWLWGARIGAATRIAEIEGGLARNELRSVNKEIEMEGGKPLSTLEINALASGVGVANAGLELVGLNAILKTVPAGKLLLEKMGQKSVRDLAKDKVFRAKLAEVTKDYALSVATEPTTEMVQEISNIIAEEYARKLGGVENTPIEQNIARVIETGKAAFGATLFLGGFGSVAKVSTIMVQNGMEKAQAEKVAESMTLDERAEFIAENADTLISTAPNQAQEIENKISENEKEDIENDFFRKAVNSGVDESQAFALSRMLGTFAQKFAPSAEKIKEWSDKIQVRYNVPSENVLYGGISNDTGNAEKRTVRIAEIEKEIQDIAANEDDIDFKRLDELEEEYNNLKREESENEETQTYNVDKNLKENFDMSSNELVDMVKADIDNILQDTDVAPEEFSLEDLRVYGSYTTGKNKETSDLDFIVQYTGTMREDDAFNMLHDEDLTIQDKNGRTVTIDINPINRELSGTIDEHIGQRYFQSESNDNNIVDLTNDFEKAPTIDEVKKYINEIVENGTKFTTLSPEWFVDVKGGHRTTKKILNAGNYKHLEKMERKRHNKYIMSLEKLLANAEYIGAKENIKKDKKPNIEKYHYFSTNVKVKNKTYQIVFDTEEYINDNKKSTSVGYAKRNLNKTEVDINSINDNTENINPKTVHLYNISEKKNNKTYYQSVYHGTPHKFDEFSLDAIGTGEGAQAHGWGLYFAGKKNVSENYRRKLTQSVEDIIYNGEKLNKNSDEYNVIVSIDNFRNVNNDTFEKAQEAYIEQFKRTAQSENEAIRDYAEKRIKIAESIDAKKIKYDGKGQLFEVDIPEIDEMLDEDKTFKEQPEKVQKALKKLSKQYSKDNRHLAEAIKEDLTGKDLYYTLTQCESVDYYEKNNDIQFNGEFEKRASKKLNELGIKGITYDGRQDGRCYVVFDDKAVQVLKKYYQRIEGENAENNGAFTPQSYDDLVERHNDKLFEQQQKYLGYFQTSGKQNLITIMENANASTLPHEMGHLFLSALNEFAIDDEEARIQLEEVDKHLGRIAGEDYTVEQHEKFARWFEAYLYTGKAPSYKLRDVFENFKEWLRSIKDYWVANYEMPKDVQKLFDNMFGEQKSVYDKEQEAKIKNTLQKVKNLTLSQRLTDTQKRHREIAYDIVARATGKKKEYLKRILESESSKKGIQKQKSDIINLVAEADDNIIGSDGFLPEWLEFFSDSELYQEGNDSKLAQAALDTILNKSYKTEISEYDFLNEADAQYKYMINQFKKGQNRDVIYSVFWEWLDGQDDFVKEIYSEQFEEDMTQIEHKEHSLEFEKIKQKILIEARKVTGKDDIEKYKKIVLTTMKGLKFLTPEDKSRMATAIFDCPSLSFLESRIDKILDMAETLNERDYRRRLFNKIDRLLEGTKNIKQGNKTVGKYDYASNKIFETLREINKLNGKQAEKYISDIKTLVDAETADDGSGISYETKLCNMLAQIRAGGKKRPYKNTPLLKQFVDELTKMKILARESKNEVEFLAKLDNQKDIEEVKNILNKKSNTMIEKNLIDSIDGKTPFLKTVGEVLKSQDKVSLKAKQLYICTVANWESALNTVFGKTIRNKYSLLHAQAEAEVWKDSMKKKFMEGAAKIYNCKIQEFDNQILKNLSEKFDFTEAIYTKQADGKYKEEFVNKRMNKMEILLAWMWYKNDVLKERLEHQFGNEQLNEVMFSYLSKEDKELGDFMMGLINEVYTPANEMYIKKYGIELPKVSSYFPSTVERGSEIDLLSDYTMKSNAPSAIKTRSNATTIRMKFSNPVAIFYNHIDSMGDFIHMTDKVDKINKVFRNPVVVSLIKNKFGDAVFKELNQEILNFSYKKQANTANWIDKVTSGIVNNWISGTLSLKLNVGFKQLLSASNYAVDMPINVWVAGFADAIIHPKETIDYMMKIPYLKTRFEGSAQNEALQQFVNSARLAKVKKFKEFLMLNVRCGDIGAIIFGGKPYIDYMIEKKGMTEQDAINAFVDQTNRTQQSSLTSSLSNFQMASRGRGLAQLFTAYRNTNNQYIRLVADEIIDYYDALNNGDLSSPELKNEARTKLAKVVFNYMFLQPLLYTLATSLSVNRWANSGGDDDDWKKDVLTSLFDMNAKAVALFGDLYSYIMNVAIKGEKGMVASMPILGEIETDINKLAKEDASIEDVLGLICVLTHASTGVDLKTPVNEVQGVLDILHGDFQRGIYRMMGYSKHRADYAILNE